jgi:hypothetical protein
MCVLTEDNLDVICSGHKFTNPLLQLLAHSTHAYPLVTLDALSRFIRVLSPQPQL